MRESIQLVSLTWEVLIVAETVTEVTLKGASIEELIRTLTETTKAVGRAAVQHEQLTAATIEMMVVKKDVLNNLAFMFESTYKLLDAHTEVLKKQPTGQKLSILEAQVRELKARLSTAEKTWRDGRSVPHSSHYKDRKSVATRPGMTNIASPTAKIEKEGPVKTRGTGKEVQQEGVFNTSLRDKLQDVASR